MQATKATAWICAAISLLCLTAGFGLAGHWEILLAIPALLLYGFLTRKIAGTATASLLLVLYTLCAALALLADLSPCLMIAGCSFALVSWDSALFSFPNVGNSTLHSSSQRLETLHLRDLVIAIGLGLLLALLGLNVRLHLPFGLVAGLAVLAAYGLYRGLRYFMN